VGKLVEKGYSMGGVGLVVGDRPNHLDCSDEYAPQWDFAGYTHEVGGIFDKLAP